MELTIGKNIRKLRRERDLTQEELAAHLGISFQAISKWERGDGYPDITLLPSLAYYFGVSVDELIGMNDITAKEAYDKYNQSWAENRRLGRHEENVGLMREALKHYPGDALLLVQLSASLERLMGNDAQKSAYLRESIAIQEQIVDRCADSEVRAAVMFNLSDAYMRAGNRTKAYEYAKKLPNLYKTRETAIARVSEDENERRAAAEEAVTRIAWLLEFHLGILEENEKLTPILDILFGSSESTK